MAPAMEGALTQEFSFIQELIWSAPHRNPFPRCSDRLIWGLKASKSDRQQSDALMLIDLRRTLCNLLASLRVSGHGEEQLVDLEKELDNILVQQVIEKWEDELHPESLDRELLVADIRKCLHPITFPLVESDTSSVTLAVEKSPGNTVIKTEPPEEPQDLAAALSLLESEAKATDESHESELLDVEMTLTARICQEEGGKSSWKLVFGLINHSCFKIDVTSLSYWPQDRVSAVTTVKWPKGEVLLNEQPSFICYSVNEVVTEGRGDSPHLCFSWSYKKSSKTGKRLRIESDEMCSCPVGMTALTGKRRLSVNQA